MGNIMLSAREKQIVKNGEDTNGGLIINQKK